MSMFTMQKVKYASLSAAFVVALLVVPGSAQAQILPIQTADSGNSLLKQMGDIFQSAMDTIQTQIHLNGMDLAAHTGSQLALIDGYTVHPDLYAMCDIAQQAAATNGMHEGAKNLAGALAGAPNQTAGVPVAKQLGAAAKAGYLDPREHPNLCALNGMNCVPDAKRVDADINFATVSANNMMQIPTSSRMTFANGVFTMPSAANVTDSDEKAWLDAYQVCVNKRPKDPLVPAAGQPASANGSPTMAAVADIAVLKAQSQRLAVLDASPSFNDCTRELLRNTAVSQAASTAYSANTPMFKTLYNTQQNWCAVLQRDGVTDDAVTNCATKGISEAKAVSLEANKFASPNYGADLSGKGLTQQQIAMVIDADRNAALMNGTMESIRDSLRAVVANTGPTNTGNAGIASLNAVTTDINQLMKKQQDLLDQQGKQFAEMNGLLRAMVDSNQAIIANQKKTQEAKASGAPQSYKVMPADLRTHSD